MSVHEYDNNMRPDSEFIPGGIPLLVEGNFCRLMDGRRTAGYIEKYFPDSAMFRWRITKYEDQGEYWDLPAEKITNFQFEKGSQKLLPRTVDSIKEAVKRFNVELKIEACREDKRKTEADIKQAVSRVKDWLEENSSYFTGSGEFDLTPTTGPKQLAEDCRKYMESINMGQLENKTAEMIVLNPHSGEWIKGMKIVLAEMGLVSYEGKITRTEGVFKGTGKKEIRRRYLINRLAFVRAYFDKTGRENVVLYRGMSTEGDWRKKTRTFLSCTFNREVGRAFCDMDRKSKYKNSYLLKMTVPVSKLFMTYLETAAMNGQYKEAEALILYDKVISI